MYPDPAADWVGVDDTYRGHEGVRSYMRQVYEAFEDYRPEVEELRRGGRQGHHARDRTRPWQRQWRDRGGPQDRPRVDDAGEQGDPPRPLPEPQTERSKP